MHKPELSWHCMVCFDELPMKSDPLASEELGEEDTNPRIDFWAIPKR